MQVDSSSVSVSASRRPSEPKPSDQRGTTPAPRPLLSTGAVLALCAVLAASTGLLHYQLIDLPNYQQQVNWHFDIVTGKGPYPDQYRLLSYFVAYGIMILGVPFAMAHVLVRFVFTATSLFVFHRYLSGWVRPPWALLGLFMLAAVLPLSFLFYFMQPTDPLNMRALISLTPHDIHRLRVSGLTIIPALAGIIFMFATTLLRAGRQRR